MGEIEEFPEYNHFLGILKSGMYVKKRYLSEIVNIPSLEYILKAEWRHRFIGPRNITDWFQYTIINKEGNPMPLKVGNFEVIYIDEDNGCTNFFGRKVQIHDIKRDTYYTYNSMKYWYEFIKEELIPLLEKLNEYGSWEEYHLAKDDRISSFGTTEAYNLYQEVIQLRKEQDSYNAKKEKLIEERDNLLSKSESLQKEKNELYSYTESLNRKIDKYQNDNVLIKKEKEQLFQEQKNVIKQYNAFKDEMTSLLKENEKLKTILSDVSNEKNEQGNELQRLKEENDKLNVIINSKKNLLNQLFK